MDWCSKKGYPHGDNHWACVCTSIKEHKEYRQSTLDPWDSKSHVTQLGKSSSRRQIRHLRLPRAAKKLGNWSSVFCRPEEEAKSDFSVGCAANSGILPIARSPHSISVACDGFMRHPAVQNVHPSSHCTSGSRILLDHLNAHEKHSPLLQLPLGALNGF